MRTGEFITVLVFVIFWVIVFCFELVYLWTYLGKKVFPISRPAIIIHTLAVLGVLCFLYGYFIEPYWIDVRRVEIVTDKFKETDLTVVQISDLHW